MVAEIKQQEITGNDSNSKSKMEYDCIEEQEEEPYNTQNGHKPTGEESSTATSEGSFSSNDGFKVNLCKRLITWRIWCVNRR